MATVIKEAVVGRQLIAPLGRTRFSDIISVMNMFGRPAGRAKQLGQIRRRHFGLKSKGKCVAVCNFPHRYGNSRGIMGSRIVSSHSTEVTFPLLPHGTRFRSPGDAKLS